MTAAGLDEALFWAVNGRNSAPADYLMYALTLSGLTTLAAVIALVAMRLHDGLSARNVLLLAASLAVAGAALHAVKRLDGADRPLAYFAKKNPPQDALVHAPFERHEAGSFPSGHAQTAFSVATFMALTFKRRRAWWFGWASLVAVSRVYLGVHFPADVLGGALLGGAVSALVVRTGAARRPAPDKGL